MGTLLRTLSGLALAAALAGHAAAEDTLKVGLILPMTGPFASTGRQVDAGARLYLQEHGDTVAGKRIELIVKDDTGVAPETTKRIAQELVTQEKVAILAGFGLTPLAFSTAPVATQAKVPMVVMAAAASAITTKSPYIVRTSFTLPQVATAIAQWSARNGIRTVFTMVTDYSPGADAETAFQKTFTALGGTIVGAVRVPLKNPDYAPFLQRAKDARPDAVFVFVPSGEGAPFMKQFADRGLAEAGIRLIGTGDTTDDDILDSMGDAALGAITAHHYSAAHPSPENKAYVASFMKANGGMRPNFMSVAGYDGMHLIVAGLEKTGGSAAGDAFIDAVKGMSWTSPRGPVKIEPDTRDITQNVYIRRVEAVDGKLFNVEFDEIDAVKDPGK